jgi:hypothetical protein
MDWRGGGLIVRSLIAAVAALLTVGGWAAVTVGPDPESTVLADGRVGAASLGQAGLAGEPAAAASLPVGITAPPPPPLPPAPTTTRPGPVTTKPNAATTTTTAGTPGPTTTTVPALPPGNMPPASSWRAEVPGLSIRLRIEPEAPVAGQTVRFRLDFTSVDKCCHVFVNPGDDNMWILHNKLVCSYEHELTPGAHSVEFTHTYAKPGAYRALVQVHDGSMCERFPETGPPFRHIEMPACIAVAPGAAAVTGCKPAPNPFPFLPPPPPPLPPPPPPPPPA